MTIKPNDLHEIAGLNSDGIAGFEAQISYGRYKLEVLWPAHLVGSRCDNFRRGSMIARGFMARRHGAGVAHRMLRADEFKEHGGYTIRDYDCYTPAERYAAQLDTLRDVMTMQARIDHALSQ